MNSCPTDATPLPRRHSCIYITVTLQRRASCCLADELLWSDCLSSFFTIARFHFGDSCHKPQIEGRTFWGAAVSDQALSFIRRAAKRRPGEIWNEQTIHLADDLEEHWGGKKKSASVFSISGDSWQADLHTSNQVATLSLLCLVSVLSQVKRGIFLFLFLFFTFFLTFLALKASHTSDYLFLFWTLFGPAYLGCPSWIFYRRGTRFKKKRGRKGEKNKLGVIRADKSSSLSTFSASFSDTLNPTPLPPTSPLVSPDGAIRQVKWLQNQEVTSSEVPGKSVCTCVRVMWRAFWKSRKMIQERKWRSGIDGRRLGEWVVRPDWRT